MTYETLAVSLDHNIARIEFNRPDKANSMNLSLWKEIRKAMQWADETSEVRAVILSGRGKHFCSGIDLGLFGNLFEITADDCEGRKREKLRSLILDFQDCLTSIEKCRKPVIAQIHGVCLGAGLDLVAACDMRYSTSDAVFCIKEIDIGMVADVGSLQRLPKLIPDGIVRELAYTGRDMLGEEAARVGLVNACFHTQEELTQAVYKTAQLIASKSPLSIRGSKEMLLYARDHSVADGLNHIATWNAAMLLSNDVFETGTAKAEKRSPVFKD